MTEEEAKTKWCPQMAMHALACDETCRRKGEEYAPGIIAARCIGSACMAWRFGQWIETETFNPQKIERVYTSDSGHGYCGLAGRP